MQNDYWTNFWKRPISRRRLLGASVLGAGAVGTAGLLGCGEEKPAIAPAGSPAAAAEPKYGGNMTFGWLAPTSEQPNQDPHLTLTGMLHFAGTGIAYSRLMRLKSGAGIPYGAIIL